MALNDSWDRLTRLDRIIVVVLLAVCAIFFVVIGLRSPGRTVLVSLDKKTIFTAPLSRDRSVELEGPLGITHLEISNGQARIASSPCPYKVCIGMGGIRRQGEIIACVPNRLLVQIVGEETGDKETGYDLISR